MHMMIYSRRRFYLWKRVTFYYSLRSFFLFEKYSFLNILFFSCFPFHMWWCMFFLLFTSQTLSDFICKPSLNLNINDSIEFFLAHFSVIYGYMASKTTVYLDHVAVFHIDLVLFMATVNPCTINFCTYWFDFQMATIEYSYHIRYNIVPHIERRWLGSQVGFFFQ